ncbi:MAG TPA: hypothetical protein V6C69_07385 [Trichormus sp.]|jgi:hypothetical protein
MKSSQAALATRILVPAVAFLAEFNLATTSAPSTDAVSIYKQPMAVQRRYFADDTSTKKNAKKTPHTDWQFRCLPQISYDIVENKTANDGRSHAVTLKINGVSLKLSVPIVMRIAKNEAKQTVEHEFGHVKICADIYANAEQQMRDYAKTLLGKAYSGSGATESDACTAALKIPFNKLSQRFTTITNDKAKRISAFYDHLDATTKLPAATQIRMAEKHEATNSPPP